MPITATTIVNFKGIKEPVRVELKPITMLFGPNSTGKSTIVQALHFAREMFDRSL
jgi:AAA15 family ATPase/GTPase